MSKVRCRIAMSLDGFVAGPNQRLEQPLGNDGLRLHDWAFPTRWFRTMHGDEGGETGVDDDVIRGAFDGVGASILGRNMFSPTRGAWGPDPWKGWWGDTPPFRHPVFVLTHHARPPLPLLGGTTFHFVTDGIEAALAQARAAAAGQDVAIGGGAQTVQQFLAAGLVDELEIHLVPLLLGAGERLFENLGGTKLEFVPLRVLPGKGVCHLKYRVARAAPPAPK